MPIFFKIQNLEGEVSAKGHEKWSEAHSLNFQVSRNIQTKAGSTASREAARPAITEIELHKAVDKISPHLFLESCIGKAKTIVIDLCKSTDTLSTFVQYTLNNAIINHYAVEIDSEHHQLSPREKIRINFDKIEMKYIPYDIKNNPGSPIPVGYDLRSADKV